MACRTSAEAWLQEVDEGNMGAGCVVLLQKEVAAAKTLEEDLGKDRSGKARAVVYILLPRLENLCQGCPDGGCWLDGLEDDSTWEAVVKAAKGTLLKVHPEDLIKARDEVAEVSRACSLELQHLVSLPLFGVIAFKIRSGHGQLPSIVALVCFHYIQTMSLALDL
eukprot:16431016-Heterocapsa_arctica.AAC.1